MSKVLLLAPMSSVHERFNAANIDALIKCGAQIHLAANFGTDAHSREYLERLREQGIITHDIPFERASLKRNFSCIPRIRKLLKEEKFDLVHCHTETGGILTRLAKTAIHGKYVYTPHGMSFYKGSSPKSQLIYKPIERFICGGMDANIGMNKEELECLVKWKKKTARFTHGAGIDVSLFRQTKCDKSEKCRELGIPEGRKILLCVGELNENKNHRLIIKALSEIPVQVRPHLLICGEGELREELKSYAENLGMGEYLTLAGYRYDMPEIMNTADIFAFPSYHEGLSAALMQAMASSLPVVCSAIRGNVDLIDENRGGYLLSPDDWEGFTEKIKILLTDKSKCDLFGKYNAEKSGDYSVEKVSDELKEIYEDLIGVTV